MPTAIAIHADLPLAWHADQAPVAGDGVLLLRVLSLLEASPPHLDDEDGPDSVRWQALEARIDLCLQLIGQLLARGAPLPPVASVALNGESARWRAAAPIAPGGRGALGLYLSPRIPQALLLPAVITGCSPDGDRWLVDAHFELHDDELQDWLDKTIFRRHRREIFDRKHPSHDD